MLSTLLSVLLIAIGIGLLYAGGEVLVSSVSHLALAFSLSPLIIGLTVVAFGTSAPELAASIVAAVNGEPELALGNVVGSNIANVGLILGITALVATLTTTTRFVWRETAFMVATGALLLPLVLTGSLTRLHGALLLLFFVVFMWMLTRGGRISDVAREKAPNGSKWRGILGSLLGLLLLVGGAKVMVDAAVELARGFGVSTELIGLTLVAFGTSVPELAGCLVAAIRRETGIVLGNIVGSNVFNTLLILPITILIRPLEVSFDGIGISVVIMIGFSALLMIFFVTHRALTRWEGLVLLIGYFAYIAYLATT